MSYSCHIRCVYEISATLCFLEEEEKISSVHDLADPLLYCWLQFLYLWKILQCHFYIFAELNLSAIQQAYMNHRKPILCYILCFWSFVGGNMSCCSFSARELSSHQLCVPDPPTHNIVFSENSQDLSFLSTSSQSEEWSFPRMKFVFFSVYIYIYIYIYECVLEFGLRECLSLGSDGL